MRVRSAIAAAALLAVLTGCSHPATTDQPSSAASVEAPGQEARAGNGTPAPAGAAKVPDPCTLITQAEATTVIGAAATSAGLAPATQPGQRTCGYANSDSGKSVLVAAWPTDTAGFDAVKTQVKAGGAVTDLAGVGDSAFIGSGMAVARKGGLAVSVLLSGGDANADLNTSLTTLLKTAVGRLQ